MGIINRITKRTLQGEMSRTLLTIFSMAIAATLVVATLVGFTSGQDSLYHAELKKTGGMQFVIRDVPRQKAAKLRQNAAVEKSLVFANLGRFTLPKAQGVTDPTTKTPELVAMDQPALTQLAKPLLVSGRVPRNHTELIVPTDLTTKKSLLGRSLTLQTAHGEQHFTVVGTMYGYQQFARAYRWITANSTRSAATPTVHVAGSLTYIKRLRSQVSALADQAGVKPRQTNIIYNENALTIIGAGADLINKAALTGFLALVLAVIGLATGIMIYTSINLGVRSRIRRYGLLRSLGATPQQIRQLVYREGIALILPALAIGYLAALTGLAGVMAFLNRRFATAGMTDMHLVLSLHPWPLLGSALFMLLITFLASARPAARAARVAPLAAVRDNLTAPHLRARQLRPSVWQRLMPTPWGQLAAKNYRRNSGTRWTMITALTVSIVIFIGFTSFIRTALQSTTITYGTGVDVSTTLVNRTDTAPLQQLAALKNVKEAAAVQVSTIQLAKRPQGFSDVYLDLLVVPPAVFARYFDNQRTLLNRAVTTVSASGQHQESWVFPKTDPPSSLIIDRHTTLPVAQMIKANTPMLRAIASDRGGLVISQAQYARLRKGRSKTMTPVSETVFMLRLRDLKKHRSTAAQVQEILSAPYIYDRIAENQTNDSFILAAQVIVYSFLALLSLVSLANIIDHIFANLLQRRGELAMLQSIGTTPAQVTRMLGLEHGRLLLISLFWGSVLGAALSYALQRQIGSIYELTFVPPWSEIAAVALVLLTVWLIFAGVSYRLVRKQNIDHWLRLT